MTIDTTRTTSPPSTSTSRTKTRVGLVLLGLVALLGLLWGVGYLLSGDRTPAEASALGVAFGGMDPAAAAERLDTGAAAQVTAPIPVRVAGEDYAVDPVRAGLSLDAGATVESAGARSWNPLTILRAFFGGGEVDPVVAVEENRLAQAVAALAEQTDREVREGDVTFDDGTAVAVAPVTGLTLDRDAAAEELVSAYLETETPVQLAIEQTPPAVSAAEVERAMTEFARPAVSAPVTLRSGGGQVRLPAEVIAPALRMDPDEAGRLRPAVDPSALEESIGDRLADLEQRPRDATVRIEDDRPVVVPARDGRTFRAQDLAAAILPALTATGRARTFEVAPRVTPAEFSTADAKALGVKEELSSFTQDFPYAAYRVTNIGEAARRIDGTLLEPGETFSMNETTGERTFENGYTTGTVISNGRFREELGGGVSTITTAVWDAAFYAGLERVEQRAHSLYISRYKPGLEATVSWGALDLKFRNDTPHGVLIEAESGDDYVTITMWGTKQYDDIDAEFGPRTNYRPAETVYDSSPDCEPQGGGVDGFDITVTRIFEKDGEVVRREPMTTSYNATNNIVCR